MITRTRISTDSDGGVHYWRPGGSPRYYTAPFRGGYVTEHSDDGTRQPCEGFARLGPTIRCEASQRLIDVIRRHHRRYMARNRRES